MHHIRGSAIPAGPESFEGFWQNIVSLSVDSQVSQRKFEPYTYSNVVLRSSKS